MAKTKHEIIDEIAGLYNLTNRSVSGGDCLYNGPDGKMCAFAHMVKPECRSLLEEGRGSDYQLDMLGKKILQDQYAGYSNAFYSDIQWLHDTSVYWTDTGLSEDGIKKVVELKLKWR